MSSIPKKKQRRMSFMGEGVVDPDRRDCGHGQILFCVRRGRAPEIARKEPNSNQ